MNILIPMAGAGSRFVEQGYVQHKPVIPTTNRRTGVKVPMVVAAVSDLPLVPLDKNSNIIFVLRDFHERNGVKNQIGAHYSNAHFITLDRLTDGQASTCLLAKEQIDNDVPLLITACDNGMDVSLSDFTQITTDADAVIFTFRNNPAVKDKPEAYGWIKTQDGHGVVTDISIKKPLSATPMNDHAVVGTFWFKHGRDFVEAAEIMIRDDERINGEFYVDQVFGNMLKRGKRIKVLEVARYFCWGTPKDYEDYERTIAYWADFIKTERAS